MLAAQNSGRVRFGPYEADLYSGELRKNGHKLKLQEQPFQVLAMLLERPGELVTRDQIRTRLWPQDTFVDFDHGLNAAVRRLREALNDNAGLPKFVETLPRRGYRFIAPVEDLSAEQTLQVGPAALPATLSDAANRHAGGIGYGSSPSIPDQAATPKRSFPVRLVGSTLLVALVLAGTFIWKRAFRRSGHGEIAQRQLTANPSEISLQTAAISPDGEYLAYSDPNGVHLQLVKTGQTQTLAEPGQFVARHLSWLPDGTGILVSGEQAEENDSIWLISILGGSPRKLRDDASKPAASPDGSQIAFLGDWRNGTAHSIWVIDVNGENARRVLAAESEDKFFNIHWSPDGKRIAFTESVPGLPSVDLPSNSVLGTNVLKSVDLNGRNPATILTKSGLQDFLWLPDGRILFSVTQEDTFGSNSNLWAVHADSEGRTNGQVKQLTNWAGFSFTDFSATTDGKRLAFLKLTAQADVDIARLEQRGMLLKAPRRLTLNDRNDWPVEFTPDSSAVIFWSDRNGDWNLYKQHLEQSTAEVIPTGSEPKWYSTFSPDGAWLIYMSLSKQENPGGSLPVTLMRIPAAGGPSQSVLSATGITDISCAHAPATTCVYDETKENQTVFTLFDPVKGRLGEVFRQPSIDAFAGEFNLSPDGSQLAIPLSDSQTGRIRLVSISRGTASDIVVNGWSGFYEINWAPDGRGLYVGTAAPQGTALLYVNLKGEARLLWSQKGGLATCGRPSRDGRFLAIASWSTDSNAWMIRNY